MWKAWVRAAATIAWGLALLCSDASAQIWDARAIVRLQSPQVRLTVKKGNETVGAVVVDRAAVARFVAVTDRIVPVIGVQPPRVLIEYDKYPNAFAALDGNKQPIMAMNTAMLKLAGDDEDLMAAVVGHELGHLKRGHVSDSVAGRETLFRILGALAGAAVDIHQAKKGHDTQGAGMAIGISGANLVNAKFTRDQEREADDIGIRVMAKVGFDPHAAARLWRLMAAQGGGGGSGLFLDTHPSDAERERQLTAVANTLNYTPGTPAMPVPPQQPIYAGGTLPQVDDPWPVSPRSGMALTWTETGAAPLSAYRQGEEALRAGRVTDAITAWQRAAEESDERAITRLGEAYLGGRGVPKDEKQAYEYYQRAAALGFTPAIFTLGEMALRGVGRPRDEAEGVRLLILARQRNMPLASARLSLMYMSGAGVPKDPVIARSLAEEAAKKGNSYGMATLGVMLREGVGGPVDAERAGQLLRGAADANPPNAFAQYQLAITYERGAGVEANRDLAVEYYKRALANGMTDARGRLRALGVSEP